MTLIIKWLCLSLSPPSSLHRPLTLFTSLCCWKCSRISLAVNAYLYYLLWYLWARGPLGRQWWRALTAPRPGINNAGRSRVSCCLISRSDFWTLPHDRVASLPGRKITVIKVPSLLCCGSASLYCKHLSNTPSVSICSFARLVSFLSRALTNRKIK